MNKQIENTREYGIFKLMQGNRKIDMNHVKKLKREMERNPEMLSANPILVNEHMFVIDGQHRLHAARELNTEVYYIVSEGATIDQTRDLNTTQRRWTLTDFAQSYADSGHEDYKKFLELAKEYPLLSLSVIRLYCVGKQMHDIDGNFRRGDFEIVDEEETRKNLDKLYEIRTITHTKMNMPMAVSLLELMKNNPDFDVDHFTSKLDRENARELFVPLPSRRGCMRSIEAVYNFHSPTMKRLY